MHAPTRSYASTASCKTIVQDKKSSCRLGSQPEPLDTITLPESAITPELVPEQMRRCMSPLGSIPTDLVFARKELVLVRKSWTRKEVLGNSVIEMSRRTCLPGARNIQPVWTGRRLLLPSRAVNKASHKNSTQNRWKGR